MTRACFTLATRASLCSPSGCGLPPIVDVFFEQQFVSFRPFGIFQYPYPARPRDSTSRPDRLADSRMKSMKVAVARV